MNKPLLVTVTILSVACGFGGGRAASAAIGPASPLAVPSPPQAAPVVRRAELRSAAIAAGKIRPMQAGEVPNFVDGLQLSVAGALRGTGAIIRRQGNTIVVEMPADVTFASGKHALQPGFRSALNALAAVLNKHRATYIDVNGHTDSAGRAATNRVLSERRALAVATYLELRGVFSGRIDAQGFGENEPRQSNATIQGRTANRRVEIVITPFVA